MPRAVGSRSNGSMRKIAVFAAPIAVVLALAGCSPFGPLSRRAEVRFTDSAEFSEKAELAIGSEMIPDDATRIDAVYYTDRPATMLAYTSGIGPQECEPGDLTGAPKLESNWWPSTEPAEGMVCGDWQVFAIGERWYAWTN